MNALLFNYYINKARYDAAAMESLYDYYYHRIVLHIGLRYGTNFAEDVAQDFFRQLKSEQIKFGYIRYPASWVYKCCENIAKKYYNEQKKFTELQTNFFDNGQIVFNEDNALLYNAIKKLEDDERKIIYLYIWEGYSFYEIAAMVNKEYSAVRLRYYRALKKLKNSIRR